MGYFAREVLEQGQALRTAAEAYRDQEGGLLREAARLVGGRPILLAGMGSSWAAALAVEACLVRQGRLAVTIEASEVLYRWLPVVGGPRGLFPILISQSGESPELVRLSAEINGSYLAITNRPDSTLARQAALTLPLHAGHEEGVTNKTFLNSVAVGMLLARALLSAKVTGAHLMGAQPTGGVEPREASSDRLPDMARLLETAEILEAAAAVEGIASRAAQQAEQVYRHLSAGETGAAPSAGPRGPSSSTAGQAGLIPWDLVGRGSGLAAVHQGALMLRELTGRTVTPFSGGLYRHGPVYRAGPGSRALLLASSSEEGQIQSSLAADILARGGRVAFFSDFRPHVDGEGLLHVHLPAVANGLFAIPALVPLQFLGLCDAAARGFEAGAGVPKVTPVE